MAIVSHERARWLSRHVLPHEPALRAWLRHRKVVGLETDDIVQEAYAKLAALQSVESVKHPKNYLFQTAQSVILTHLRRARVVSIDAVGEIDNLKISATAPSPERQLEDRQELLLLAEAIASLPASCREVLRLRRVEGLSQREVAERLALSENSVEHHMGRAIRFLMDRFGRGGKAGSQASITVNKHDSEYDDQAKNQSRD